MRIIDVAPNIAWSDHELGGFPEIAELRSANTKPAMLTKSAGTASATVRAPGPLGGEDVQMRDIDRAMERLRAAERERRAAIEELMLLGVVRSRVLVGDLGEQIAARYYGVELAPAFTPGHDLIDRRGRRIDVKTLRATPERPRSIIGELKEPCDVLLAIRLAFDYTPTEALEMPIAVAREYVGKNGKVSWTQRLATDPRVLRIDPADLLPE